MRTVAWLALVAVAATGCVNPTVNFDDPRVEQIRGILWMGRTASVEVIVHAQPGYEPAPATVTAVEGEGARLIGKPVRVVVRVEDYAFQEDMRWDAASLAAVREPAVAEQWPEGIALVHAFALPGCYRHSEERPCISGAAGSSATIFSRANERDEAIPLNSQPLARDVPVVGWYQEERYLYVHELGHVFGLVGNPLEQVQERLSSDACLCHSIDSESVMGSSARGVRVDLQNPSEFLETFEDDTFARYQYSDRDIEDVRAFQATEP